MLPVDDDPEEAQEAQPLPSAGSIAKRTTEEAESGKIHYSTVKGIGFYGSGFAACVLRLVGLLIL